MNAINSTRSRYVVKPTYDITGTDASAVLEPVTFICSTGQCGIQDYLTCDQARDLGAGLLATALKIEADAEGIRDTATFDAHVDAKLQGLRFIGLPQEDDTLDVALGGGRN